MAFNPISRTYLLAGLNVNNDFTMAAELNSVGVRTTDENTVSTTSGFYTRVVSSLTAKRWNTSFCATNFTAMRNQIVETVGGGPPPPPPPPPPKPPNPLMNIDVPAPSAITTPNSGLMLAGWAIDAGALSGTGVNTVHVWAFPVGGGSPQFLGVATYGYARPDVGGAFGGQFTPSGYALSFALPTPGTYDIAAFAFSTVTNGFNNVKTVRVTVEAPPSIPYMWVDAPGRGDNVSQNITVAGWAVDLGQGTGSGVDAIHVWGYPANGSAPIFVGYGIVGLLRPDVGAAFGSSRFTPSGFVVQGTLPPGDFTLAVFAHSTIANAFNNVSVVKVTVR
jgi:hypothetical protein